MRKQPKTVLNSRARFILKHGRHEQKTYRLRSDDDSKFQVYLRQNLNDDMDFSCGLSLIRTQGKHLSLVRYNGANHRHGDIVFQCHIHHATSHALQTGLSVDHHAEPTDRYRSLNGALACSIEDCKVDGITSAYDKPDLFDAS